MVKNICVIPTHDLKMLKKWVDNWHLRFITEKSWKQETVVYVVFDGNEKIPPFFKLFPSGSKWFNRQDIEDHLGENSWVFPQKTSACRTYGYLMAYKEWKINPNIEMILTIDHDCFPIKDKDWITEHSEVLKNPYENSVSHAWFRTSSHATRGEPFQQQNRNIPCVLNHGLWENVPDFDAIQRMTFLRDENLYTQEQFSWPSQIVPRGQFFAMCGMNLAWKPEFTPAMYFGLQGPDWPFNRFDDIWAGFMVKKIADHLNLAVHSGDPAVWHERLSGLFYSYENEHLGVLHNEALWQVFDNLIIPMDFCEVDLSLQQRVSKCVSFVSQNVYGVLSKTTEDKKLKPYWKQLNTAHNLWLEALNEK